MIGGVYFRREYFMGYQSFLRLHDKLQPGILASLRIILKYELNGLHSETNKPPPIPNGPISTKVRLAAALRYFDGGSPYDIMSVYGMSHTAVLDSVWSVVEAVNQFPEFYRIPQFTHQTKQNCKGIRTSKCCWIFKLCRGSWQGIDLDSQTN